MWYTAGKKGVNKEMDGVIIQVTADDFSIQDYGDKTLHSIHSREDWFTLDPLWAF